jgi:hypothetical protein
LIAAAVLVSATPDQPPPATPHRTARKWVILLLVWGVGLLVWTLYIAGIVAAFVYVFG